MELFLGRLDPKSFPGCETIPVKDSIGRVTSQPVFARLSSPYFHTAAMDGFALNCEDTYGAGPDNPLQLVVGKNAWAVNTGRPVPNNTNAVVMIENVNFLDDENFEIEKALTPWENVRRVGEDFVASEMIVPGHHKITAYEVGAILSAGISRIEVIKRPKVLFIPSGSELISADEASEMDPPAGSVIEFNTVILSGLAEQAGAIADCAPIVKDDYESIQAAIMEGVDADYNMVVLNAGSSAGSEDYSATAIKSLGEILVHGVAMMPGKPTILGIIKGKPVIGNPGYPVSAVLSFEMFGLPVISRMLGVKAFSRPTMSAVVARKIPSKLGREEFFRVKLGKVGDKVIAAPLPRGAGSITTLTRADGILRIPSNVEGVDRDATVSVELLRSPDSIERNLVIIGSHDLTLDVLADELISSNIFVSSSNVGSLGGLLAIKNRSCHFATSHLLDEETGEYNWSYIKKYIPDIPVKLINAVHREQGLMVPKGNPKNIKGFEDLVRKDVTFINRQKGAGTRVLLDYYLQKMNLDPSEIKGYSLEEYTHTSVAVAVLSGVADVGMGVMAAAKALGLDFIPVATEQYDLVIPEEFMEDEKIARMLEVIRGDSFKKKVLALGGYGVEMTGKFV